LEKRSIVERKVLCGMKKYKGLSIYLGIGVGILVLNVAARSSAAFCNWYIAYVLPIGVNTLGRVMGWVPFSVGELLIGVGLVWGALVVVFSLIQGVMVCRSLWLQLGGSKRESIAKLRQTVFFRFVRRFDLGLAWVGLGILLLCTLNGFMLYHGDTFAQMYFPTQVESYSLEELTYVRNYVVEQCNRLSELVERDAEGNPVYRGDMKDAAITSMQHLGETYARLDGYYPRPKALVTSDFCCQQYIQGYYFPFTMEANYNRVMYITNKPATMCHELAHLRGYLLEDEANFIGFLACIHSDDVFFRYSGYLSVLNYLDNDFYRALGENRQLYMEQPKILTQVSDDNVFVTTAQWERIEREGWFQTEEVDAVTDTIIDANLKANGIKDGIKSYSRVVTLVLQYYEG
jgi:hypothetical protein